MQFVISSHKCIVFPGSYSGEFFFTGMVPIYAILTRIVSADIVEITFTKMLFFFKLVVFIW